MIGSKLVCGCDCSGGDRIIVGGGNAHEYTSRCQCTLCGEDGTGCTVFVMGSFAKAWWFIQRHGRSPTPYRDDKLEATPIFCADCFDHALSLTMHNVSEESSRKGKGLMMAVIMMLELIQAPQQNHAVFFDTRKPRRL